ncbi:hypothetical protein CEXT_379421 [Caerostris extrusa]|uniref:Uncharacterized protein n=1 Tax=Caerostris extrusa TaxID=172846 RepID=A0AAV4RV90_CAEEX|nr:hypothetical protein CEXT_379421 [Caerostris extrusa]
MQTSRYIQQDESSFFCTTHLQNSSTSTRIWYINYAHSDSIPVSLRRKSASREESSHLVFAVIRETDTEIIIESSRIDPWFTKFATVFPTDKKGTNAIIIFSQFKVKRQKHICTPR